MLLFSWVQRGQEFTHAHYKATRQRLRNYLPEVSVLKTPCSLVY